MKATYSMAARGTWWLSGSGARGISRGAAAMMQSSAGCFASTLLLRLWQSWQRQQQLAAHTGSCQSWGVKAPFFWSHHVPLPDAARQLPCIGAGHPLLLTAFCCIDGLLHRWVDAATGTSTADAARGNGGTAVPLHALRACLSARCGNLLNLFIKAPLNMLGFC